ncbi:DUF3710 domain-containing protein [Corynebacterium sp. A21]|uniref:DUF3710 domain-containing protein n=1 Tax=Corynebacterium sp. A21 TaxID=3457318 RepID=UPI003FD32AA5
MALWPFGKKKDKDTGEEITETPVAVTPAATGEPVSAPEPAAPETTSPETSDLPDPEHDATNGGTGPFDGDTVEIGDFDFQDFSTGTLNLGSMQIPLPRESQVQVEMSDQGPKMLHIVTTVGRITPVSFAAPRKPGQWREASRDIAEGMRKEGLTVVVEQGPWGREVVGSSANGIIRIIGVDGPRWMLRMTLAAPADKAEELAVLGREVTARTFIYRGDEPILAGSALPVALPTQLAQQVQQAMQQRTQQAAQAAPDAQNTQRAPMGGVPGGSGSAALSPEQQQALQEAQNALQSLGDTGQGDTNPPQPTERQ